MKRMKFTNSPKGKKKLKNIIKSIKCVKSAKNNKNSKSSENMRMLNSVESVSSCDIGMRFVLLTFLVIELTVIGSEKVPVKFIHRTSTV
jgi:hypothetical protein